MAAAAIIAASSQIISGVQSLSGGNNQDPERLAANSDAYARAQGGDANALAFLKQRTGEYGIANVPGYGQIGGWATPNAKADAKAKYNALTTAAGVNSAIASAGQQVRDVALSAGYDVHPTVGGMKTEHLVMLAGVAVVVFLYFRKGR